MESPLQNSMYNRIRDIFQEIVFRRRLSLPPELHSSNRLTCAINVIESRWPDISQTINDQERPVFVFSAGWRSGSTLMQRLLMSSGKIVIWGEPLGDTALIPRLGYSLSAINHDWPPEHFFDTEGGVSDLSGKWIANLTPQMQYLHNSHRLLIKEWLASSARESFGLERWGMKEVRLTIDHARYLKWLFPNARFIFIYRNPFDAFRSWKGNRWSSVWPGYHRNSAFTFARHWNLLLHGFSQGYKDVDGIMVKFEDLVSGKTDIDMLAKHVGISSLDPSVLTKVIRTKDGTSSKLQVNISFLDRAIISIICRNLINKHHYKSSHSPCNTS